ncbi:MAG: glycosyltransferase family 39 protein [Chloroflexi bacterium]|nr:glycosyltransferase family 39 protein [Chloroflexota bacterium]
MDAFNADATNPPLYYGLLHFAASAFGTSEFALRFVSLLIGLPVIPLTFYLGAQVAGRRAGVIAALLAVFSAPLWWASQEARMYTLLALLVLICALAWERLRRRPTRLAWQALWVAEVLLLYTHNTGPVIALWLNGVTLLWWVTRRQLKRPSWRLWFAGQILVGLLWLPYFATRFLALPGANNAIQTRLTVEDLPALLLSLWNGFWQAPPRPIPPLEREAILVIFALTAVLLIAALYAAARPAGRWLALHIIALTGGLLAGLLVLGNDLHGRYLVMLVPLMAALAAAGLARWPLALRGGALLAALAVFALSVATAVRPENAHDDARGMVRYYAETLAADDTVLAWSYADRYELAYYWERFGVPARRVTLPEGADLEIVRPLLPTTGRVALNIWYTQRADYRGMMGCLLAHGVDGPPAEFTTAGMTNLLFERAPESLPRMRSVQWTFADGLGTPMATVRAAADVPGFPSHQSMCLPIELENGQGEADLKAAVLVRGPLGDVIAQTDAVFATADQRLTSTLLPGERADAFPLIALPFGSPSGNYPVYLRLYTSHADSGEPKDLEPPRDQGPVVGRDLLLGVWDAGSGTWLPPAAAPMEADRLSGIDLAPADGAMVRNGDAIRVTLVWQGEGQTEVVTLNDEAGSWSESSTVEQALIPGVLRQWYVLRVPAEAASGTVVLRVGDSEIARFTVEAAPMLTELPDMTYRIDASFPEVGVLVGPSLPDGPMQRATEPLVSLVWQAEGPSAESYTVFVQLLDASGQVVAQSDAVPASGTRPTTGWRAGEVVIDEHRLRFNERATPGTARLIAGLYDPLTGRRVPLSDGLDYAVIAEAVEVE